jgi:hypothetical protein
MRRLALPFLAALFCVTGCAGTGPTEPTGPRGSADGEVSSAIGLVDLWRVSGAAGEADATWLRLDAHEFQLWRECGMIQGSWAATDTLLLTSVAMASGECASDGIPEVEWLDSVTGFVMVDGGYELVDAEGDAVATLTIDGAPEPIPTAADFYAEPPLVTEDVLAMFARPAPLPLGFAAASANRLPGRWAPVTEPPLSEPYVEFEADGSYTASDGCNDGGGRWALERGGGLLATSGPFTLVYCEGVAVPSWMAAATSAGMDPAGFLVLFDRAGAELGRLRAA